MAPDPPFAPSNTPRVGLFVTCLVDLFRPNVGFAAVKLLEDAGCRVEVPEQQTCCGQPAYNSGDRPDACEIAKQVIASFEGFDYVVAPSGSCIGMLKAHYPVLFSEDARWRGRAEALAARCYELVSFLSDVLDIKTVDASFAAAVTYHDSCSGLRELDIEQQPRRLLETVQGLRINEMADTDVCCGFGGTFCVKYPEISERMVTNKAQNAEASGAEVLLAGDLGCLLNIAGRLKRLGSPIKTYHVAEVLAGMTAAAPIGETTGDAKDPDQTNLAKTEGADARRQPGARRKNTSVFDRRATPLAPMQQRPNRTSFSGRGPKGSKT